MIGELVKLSAMSFKFAQFLLSLICVRQVTIHVPLTTKEVRSRLTANLIPDVLAQPSSSWSWTRRYSGRLDDRFLFMRGPLVERLSGYSSRKNLCLVTKGEITSDSQGTTLKLTVRMTAFNAFFAVLLLAWIPGWVFVLGWPLGLWPIVLMPVMVIYAVMICNFHYEAALILKLIKQVLLHPPQSHINPIKFSL